MLEMKQGLKILMASTIPLWVLEQDTGLLMGFKIHLSELMPVRITEKLLLQGRGVPIHLLGIMLLLPLMPWVFGVTTMLLLAVMPHWEAQHSINWLLNQIR
ncbi:hypothetical protein D9M72_616670 [compost metagenome]